MKFSEILRGVATESRTGEAEVSGVQYDSRKVSSGSLFVAMRGETTDGNRYIDVAVKQGTVAVVTDSTTEKPRAGVAWARVDHGRRALEGISANFYGHPAEKLKIVGVTGTNGKTTTTFLLDSLLQNLGAPAPVLIGTIEYHVGGKVLPSPHTTPESLELNAMFAEATNDKFSAKKAEHAVMEVSSHALEQGRVWGIPFEVAVFTNLTRDHLDFHGDMQKYSAAKQLLFEDAGSAPPKFAVVNSDDEFGRKLAGVARQKGSSVVTYGLEGDANLKAESIRLTPQGTKFSLRTTSGGEFEIGSPLIGKVNVHNLLAAMGAASALGYEWSAIVKAAAFSKGVPGRFEKVSIGAEQPFTVVVDYAHTDDALRNLTAAARDFVHGKGRVITLFGCGGDRDRSKRPLMGHAAGEGSDFVVLTSDNPRSEDPLAIMQDAMMGLKQTGTHHAAEADRRRAIALAIDAAKPGDIVLIAGKGHEKTQTTREGVFPFDDVEEARKALERRFTKVMERAR
jgi:UDP-N-acetylmuramoyl-L-alanyl-D-glutamate--2,6-diaminopimelate ligase